MRIFNVPHADFSVTSYREINHNVESGICQIRNGITTSNKPKFFKESKTVRNRQIRKKSIQEQTETKLQSKYIQTKIKANKKSN